MPNKTKDLTPEQKYKELKKLCNEVSKKPSDFLKYGTTVMSVEKYRQILEQK
jgi:hypothetical protein